MHILHDWIQAPQGMLGSTIINHHQHVGLQKLSLIAGLSHSFLGPSKKYKFIQDDSTGDSALVCSCFGMCENLDLTCSTGQLVYETIQAHQKMYHTGSGCLLFLAGAWSRAALECLQRGISIEHIISAMSEGLDKCLDVCRKSSESIAGLGTVQKESSTPVSHCSGLVLSKEPALKAAQVSCNLQHASKVCPKTLNSARQRKIKLSRHFYEDVSQNVSQPLQNNQPKLPDIAHIAEGLNHGCISAMNLVVEVSGHQSKSDQQDIACPTFDVTKLMTCVLPGLPEENACVVSGCIVLLSTEQASVANHLQDKVLKVALIHGDLSGTYRHLGFKRPTGIQHVKEDTDLLHSSKEEAWMEKLLSILLNLEVNLILASGLVSENMIKRCFRNRILAVEKVKVSVLTALADSTGAVPVTYASQLSKHSVGAGVKIAMWKDLGSYGRQPLTAVNIFTEGNNELVTVVLTSCVKDKLQALEDQFWACAFRLHYALKDKALLPGAGVTEMLCIHQLQKLAEGGSVQESKAETETNPYRGVVLHFMAEGLIDYVSTVMTNTGKLSKVQARTAVSQQLQEKSLGFTTKFSPLSLEGEVSSPLISSKALQTKVYDNLSVKQEAWIKALDLVFLVLQTDAEIITGIDQTTDAALENLMLL